jgi:hypothetical protein
VLFSHPEIAAYINRHFEPVWESVRPAPIVTIDFGEMVVTRTLNGNIATYVCASDGHVLDVLPGIYEPTRYLGALDQFRLLAVYAGRSGDAQRRTRLLTYHQEQIKALEVHHEPAVLVESAGITKLRVEGATQVVLAGPTAKGLTERLMGALVSTAAVGDARDVASWQELVDDTRLNETVRRRQIHALLAAAPTPTPGQVVKRLYKDVLHADLDDPYLGLKKVLYASYPFAGEESAAARR